MCRDTPYDFLHSRVLVRWIQRPDRLGFLCEHMYTIEVFHTPNESFDFFAAA